jgi:Rrf2 family protein
MVKLSRTVEYAVHAVLMLAKADGSHPVPCSQLATNGGMPLRFLLQVLRNLVLHEVVSSTRGVEGGYSLAREPQQITLLEVFEAIEGPVVSSARPSTLMAGGVQSKLQESFHAATVAMRRKLASVTMADLLKADLPAANDPARHATHAPLLIDGPPPSTFLNSEPRA